ncbi:MAG: OmpA family protein [Bacteroidota bacterium]
MRLLFLLVMGLFVIQSAFAQGDLPPNPQPGKCYVRCTTPDIYETTEQTILVKPAHRRLVVRPAEYDVVEETILIKPATKGYRYIPATFRTVQQEMEVEQPYNAVAIIPAQFSSSSEMIEVRPKTVGWDYRAAGANCYSSDPRDCEVLCYVERPAEFRTIPTQVVANGPSTNTTPRGGRTITVDMQEIDTPARVEEYEIPAEYRTITKRVLIQDETVEEIEVPAEYATVTVERLKEAGGVNVWQEVDCDLVDTNILPITYDLGSARLTREARNIIDDRLLTMMRNTPNVSVEISSHTDSRGSSSSNLSLSERRAKSVVQYLVSKGVSRSRLVSRGYGETRLKNRCSDGVTCSDSEHRENRRTEFRVINRG